MLLMMLMIVIAKMLSVVMMMAMKTMLVMKVMRMMWVLLLMMMQMHLIMTVPCLHCRQQGKSGVDVPAPDFTNATMSKPGTKRQRTLRPEEVA